MMREKLPSLLQPAKIATGRQERSHRTKSPNWMRFVRECLNRPVCSAFCSSGSFRTGRPMA